MIIKIEKFKTPLVATSYGAKKEAGARVFMTKKITPDETISCKVNNKEMLAYFTRTSLITRAIAPILETKAFMDYEFSFQVFGGGLAGQANAIRYGVSKAIVGLDENMRVIMRAHKFLTRDSRVKAQDRIGQKGPRAKKQSPKR